MTTVAKPCPNGTPSWFTGHWRDWHRGHGCDRDDGKPRSGNALTEIAQHEARKDTGYLTDAELGLLRARTTSGDALLVCALDELAARRAAAKGGGEPVTGSFSARVDSTVAQFRTLRGWKITSGGGNYFGQCVFNSDAKIAHVYPWPGEGPTAEPAEYVLHEVLHVAVRAAANDHALEEEFVQDLCRLVRGGVS